MWGLSDMRYQSRYLECLGYAYAFDEGNMSTRVYFKSVINIYELQLKAVLLLRVLGAGISGRVVGDFFSANKQRTLPEHKLILLKPLVENSLSIPRSNFGPSFTLQNGVLKFGHHGCCHIKTHKRESKRSTLGVKISLISGVL